MILIQFEGYKTKHEVSYSNVSDHVCELVGDFPHRKTGFITFSSRTGQQLGDRSEFRTVYREWDGGCQYSDDGSVWVEPVVPELLPFEPDPSDTSEPSQYDRIEAQALYTALMTDTLLEENEGE